MEIQLQLDGNGRTTWARPTSEIQEERSEAQDSATAIDFSSKTTMTSLVPPTAHKSGLDDAEWRTWMDNILFDCEISDCGLMPRTFWMPADGTKPRCVLEQLACDVFHHHVPCEDCSFDPTTSGAEWWVQIRPSPPGIGRYSMHDTHPDSISSTGISFHWDKDEDLRLLAGGNLYVHPYLSTVTYLTSLGAPTMVVNCRVHTTTGDWIVPNNETVEAYVSWPKAGKHLSFDGQLLHAAPPDLMQDGVFEQQCKIPVNELNNVSSDEKQAARLCKILERRHRRVTFLVNIWLNYKPFNVEPFPETMIDKLTKVDDSKWSGMFTEGNIVDKSRVVNERQVAVQEGKVEEMQVCASESPNGDETQTFTWPMGDCDSRETIQMDIPLRSIRSEASEGGNIRIEWKRNDKGTIGVSLRKGDKPPSTVLEMKERANTSDGAADDTVVGTDNDESRTNAKRLKVDCTDDAKP